MNGSLHVITGSMFSGKSSELLRRIRRAVLAGKKVLVFKHAIDTRYDIEAIVTHDGLRYDSVSFDSVYDMLEFELSDTDVVCIEEVQFFEPAVVEYCNSIADKGYTVIVAGTETDFRGDPFGPMGDLMCTAETITKLDAICVRCGESAHRNQRLVDGKPAPPDMPVVVVGSSDYYEARCRSCFEIGRKNE